MLFSGPLAAEYRLYKWYNTSNMVTKRTKTTHAMRLAPRPAVVINNLTMIPLGVGARDGYAIVDSDQSGLGIHKWSLGANGYAIGCCYIEGKKVYTSMHRLIMGVDSNHFIDHRNHNKLDNRLDNLRIATHSTNQANKVSTGGSSKYKGVQRMKRVRTADLWRARIKVHGVWFYLGNHLTERDAALAYNEAAIQYFGEFALLNDV
jgi:hypothetical protein